jgi:competence protein ComEC
MKININTATEIELQSIIHIGVKRAKLVIEHRPYGDMFEISNVPGLGKKRMLDIINQGYAVTR